MTWGAVGSLINATASTFSLTPGGTGHLILLEVVAEGPAGVWCTGVSSSNATWAQKGNVFGGTVKIYTAAVFAGTVTSTSAQTVTLTFNGSPTLIRVNGKEFSSTIGSWTFQVQGNLDSAGTATWPSLTPAVSGELYFGWGYDSGTAAAGSTSGYAYGTDVQGNGVAYNLNCAAGTATAPVWGDSAMQFGISVLLVEGAWSPPVTHGLLASTWP